MSSPFLPKIHKRTLVVTNIITFAAFLVTQYYWSVTIERLGLMNDLIEILLVICGGGQ